MKRYKRYFKESYLDFHITDEMISWFKERTLRHIELVKEYGHKIEDVLLNKDDQWKQRFRYNLDTHDSIKFEDPEFVLYIVNSFIDGTYLKDFAKKSYHNIVKDRLEVK